MRQRQSKASLVVEFFETAPFDVAVEVAAIVKDVMRRRAIAQRPIATYAGDTAETATRRRRTRGGIVPAPPAVEGEAQ